MGRIALVMLLAAVALGVAPTGATCAGPFGNPGVCHDRDPATDHDGRDPDRGSCAGLR
jgi:hypothetical protein